jgi:drug/metabolite transporter (DMT)-like permease
MAEKLTGWPSLVSLLMAAACWGVGGVMSKRALAEIGPLTLLVIQLAVSVTILWALVAVQRSPFPSRREVIQLGAIGLLNPGLAYTFTLIGLKFTTASVSALLWASEPILILGLAVLILRERLTPPLIVCSLLAISGVVLVAGLNVGTGNASALLGVAIILAGVGCCALYTVFTRRLTTTLDPVLLVALQQTVALMWALVIWPIEVTQTATAAPATIEVWGWALASGLVYYALAFWFFINGLKRTTASLAGFFLNLIPIFGLTAAAIILGERLSSLQWVGAVLILIAAIGLWGWQNTDEVTTTGISATAA